jgi:hypothetical protein
MFVTAPHDVLRHAEIERAVFPARKEINVVCHLEYWGYGFRARSLCSRAGMTNDGAVGQISKAQSKFYPSKFTAAVLAPQSSTATRSPAAGRQRPDNGAAKAAALPGSATTRSPECGLRLTDGVVADQRRFRPAVGGFALLAPRNDGRILACFRQLSDKPRSYPFNPLKVRKTP